MNLDISVFVKKYLVSGLIALFGLIMIIVGLQTGQETLYMMAATNILVGGLLAILFSASVFSRNVVFGIGLLCVVITIFVAYFTVQSVNATIAHNEAREKSEQIVRFNLTQIREIQRAHKKTNGVYASDWEELIDFYNNGEIEVVESEKPVPARAITIEERDAIYGDNRPIDQAMTEEEATALARLGNPSNDVALDGFRRDTVVKKFKDEYENSISRIKERRRLGIVDFDINELRYIPMTDPKEEWSIETRDSLRYGNDTIPTIRVEGKEPVPLFENGKRQTVGFGNIKTNSDKGSWE